MLSMRFVLTRLVGTILGVLTTETARRPAPPTEDDLKAVAARQRLLEVVEQLYNVGLAGERFQVLFAEVMDSVMADFVVAAYGGVWTASQNDHPFRGKKQLPGSSCIASLRDWVEDHYARLAVEVLGRIAPHHRGPPVTLADVKTYESVALGRLAALRISELFDIVLAWPSSRGALADLSAAVVSSPARRLHLTESFAAALQSRLLHPGRSTLDILQTYIAVIRTFHALDNSKVLLGRVVPGLQLYLCSREDAVRIVVTGLLASPEEIQAAKQARHQHQPAAETLPALMTPAAHSNPSPAPILDDAFEQATIRDAVPLDPPSSGDKLVELAVLLASGSESSGGATGEDDTDPLDWDDMSWVPDPIDAGANYRRPKGEDVIGTLISALGTPEGFIREFQTVVAERLLSEPSRQEFDQEARVLQLLKKRFGEASLQGCDVMLRDVRDSRRLDGVIVRRWGAPGPSRPRQTETPRRGAPGRDTDAEPQAAPGFHARILSRLFWPSLDCDHFVLPGPVAAQQRRYERGYEALKATRKLTWLDGLGQATVELALRDRVVEVQCKTYEAAVIYAFRDDDDQPSGDAPVQKTAAQLEEALQMDDDMLASALDFWVSKGVLRRCPGPEPAYAVVENLSEQPAAASASALDSSPSAPERQPASSSAAAADLPSTTAAVDSKEQARRQMYWQYVRGMLTNASASMPLAQVAMMLKMLVPADAGGFAWSNEELAEFLAEKVATGELDLVTGRYRLVKK
jgi:anaphase-promoting complex subunit 2